MTTTQSRPGVGPRTAQVASDAAAIVAETADNGTGTRPRCARCHHPLVLPRSLARGFGRVCWSRTAVAQLDARRDAVGRRLGSLARRVAQLDVADLAVVSAMLEDALDATGGVR